MKRPSIFIHFLVQENRGLAVEVENMVCCERMFHIVCGELCSMFCLLILVLGEPLRKPQPVVECCEDPYTHRQKEPGGMVSARPG